jgi:hypothetical protein
MRQFTWVVVVISAGVLCCTGCRSTCSDRTGWFASRNGSASCLTSGSNACRDVTPSAFAPVGLSGQPPEGWMADGSFPGSLPVYPAGEPIPIRPGAFGPENELPSPRIAPPGVPEFSPATPMPAIPQATGLKSPSARTTGDAKSGR